MTSTRDRILTAMAARTNRPATAVELSAVIPFGPPAIGVQFRNLAAQGLVRAVAGESRPTGGRPAGLWELTNAGWVAAGGVASIPEPVTHRVVADLKKLREQRRLTPARAGRRAGLGPNTVGLWESGDRTPGLDHLARYAESLGYEITLSPSTTPTLETTT